MTSISKFAASAAIFLSSVYVISAQDGFRQVAIPDIGETTPMGVVFPSICIGDFMVPKTMYTVEPVVGTEVKVLTNPPDLVEVGYDEVDELFYFKFIQEISQDADDAGVIVQFPSGQLRSVNTCCSQSVQIKEGFTNFQSLTVSTNAIVDASFAVQQNTNMVVGVYSGAEANVKVTETFGSKNTGVNIIATDNAKVNIDGDISTLSCNDQSDCMIAGAISNPNESRSRGRSYIQTTTCEDIDVSEDSNCESRTPTVTVDVAGDLFITGVKEACVGGEDLEGLGLFSLNGSDEPTSSPVPSLSTPTVNTVPTQSPVVASPTNAPANLVPTLAPVRQTLPPTTAPISAVFDVAKRGVLNSIVITTICCSFLLLLLI